MVWTACSAVCMSGNVCAGCSLSSTGHTRLACSEPPALGHTFNDKKQSRLGVAGAIHCPVKNGETHPIANIPSEHSCSYKPTPAAESS